MLIGSYLSGEQMIPMLIAFLGLSFLVLALLSWALIHLLRPRIGNKAYLLATLPFVLAVTVVFAEYEREKPNSGPPKVLPPEKVAHLMDSLPKDAPFALSGLSYFDGDLFASSNVGMFQIHDGKLSKLYQFQSSDSVVSGPWLDNANHLLWAIDDHTGELLRFDGNRWQRIKKPEPSKGYYSRGDILEGVRPVGNDTGFWLATAGSAWKWNPESARWQIISHDLAPPKDFHTVNEIVGVLPVGPKAFLIIRHQPLSFLVHPDEDFAPDEIVEAADSSKVLRGDGEPFLADTWAAARDAAYICTKKHTLIRVTTQEVSSVKTPGSCETVSSDHEMNLLISIKTKGIFKYSRDNSWTLIAPSPYQSGDGEYWSHIAESKGQLAFAIEAQPVADHEHSAGRDMKFVQNAPNALWVSKDGHFIPVTFR
jgi:hypothetical protein